MQQFSFEFVWAELYICLFVGHNQGAHRVLLNQKYTDNQQFWYFSFFCTKIVSKYTGTAFLWLVYCKKATKLPVKLLKIEWYVDVFANLMTLNHNPK